MKWVFKIKFAFLAVAVVLILAGIYLAFILTPTHGEELFTLDTSYKQYLGDGELDPVIVQVFVEKDNITFDPNETTVEEYKGTPISKGYWKITTEEKNITEVYRIVDHGDELVVSHDVMGDVQRIFYFHVAHAWVSYVAFIVTLVASLLFLWKRQLKYDRLAAISAGIGVIYCGVAIVTGCLWAKGVWGNYWRWEDFKLNSTLVLWLIFIAYMVLRANVKDKMKRGNLSAVFGIIGALCVPLSFGANRIWNHYHPTVIASDEGSLQPIMGMTLGLCVIAFTFFYLYLLLFKLEVELMKEKAEDLKQRIGD